MTLAQSRSVIVPVSVLIVSMSMSACIDGNPPPQGVTSWHGRDLGAPGWQNATLEGGWSLELNYHRSAGTSLSWDWLVEGERVAYFDVHTHDGDSAPLLYQKRATQDEASLDVPEERELSLLWTNDGDHPIRLWFNVPPDFSGYRLPPSS